ncbi:TetR/AcrR family transcriptional regulator [Stenotrophomonas rhizophila]|uniref:TetR/AcrR family transcriptional regulator n=1 Tax=Stenotrophomonas rhizophila TaxID=216778 RepID=UPI0028A8A641|nr:TetR/AcrR family transcriptional regulator [Stenotrophomonas rhizophila]
MRSPQYSRKPHILATASALFAERGYMEVCMNEIAALSGVTKKTVYLHFASKEALYSKVVKVWMGALPRLPVLANAKGELKDDLSTAAQALLKDASHPLCRRFAIALLNPSLGSSTRPLWFWLARRARFVRSLESLLTRHDLAQPHLAAQQFVTLLLSLLEFPARCNFLGPVHVPSRTAVDTTINLLVRAHPPNSAHLTDQSDSRFIPRKTRASCPHHSSTVGPTQVL